MQHVNYVETSQVSSINYLSSDKLMKEYNQLTLETIKLMDSMMIELKAKIRGDE